MNKNEGLFDGPLPMTGVVRVYRQYLNLTIVDIGGNEPELIYGEVFRRAIRKMPEIVEKIDFEGDHEGEELKQQLAKFADYKIRVLNER